MVLYGATEPALPSTPASAMAPQIFEREVYCIFDLLFAILPALLAAIFSNFTMVISSIVDGILDINLQQYWLHIYQVLLVSLKVYFNDCCTRNWCSFSNTI